jgi:hypothetical protein
VNQNLVSRKSKYSNLEIITWIIGNRILGNMIFEILHLFPKILKILSTYITKMKTKTCTKCRKEKELAEFSKSSRIRSGYITQCKGCQKAYNKARYVKLKSDPEALEKIRRQHANSRKKRREDPEYCQLEKLRKQAKNDEDIAEELKALVAKRKADRAKALQKRREKQELKRSEARKFLEQQEKQYKRQIMQSPMQFVKLNRLMYNESKYSLQRYEAECLKIFNICREGGKWTEEQFHKKRQALADFVEAQ